MPTVFVIGQDWTFRVAVRAELLEQGVEALGLATWADAQQAARATVPDVVVLDAASADFPAASFSSFAPSAQFVVMSSGLHPLPALPPGAVHLKKPLRVGEIVAAVRHLMEGHPA